LALQNAHAAVAPSSALASVSNKYEKGRIAIKPCYIGAIRIRGRLGVLWWHFLPHSGQFFLSRNTHWQMWDFM
jgi:hypothetical protein